MINDTRQTMDRQHVEQLFRQHYRHMYAVACSLLYDEQESQDVVSEVFASLLERDAELLPASAEGYLVVAVRNRCLKRLRDKGSRERIAQLYTSEQQEDNWQEDERRLALLRHLAQTLLTPQELHLFTSRFLDGKDYKTICAETGISRIAVWKHLSHIVKVLKENIKTPEL